MHVLWEAQGEPLRVRDVLERLPSEPAVPMTVMTVLDNLHRKGWVVLGAQRWPRLSLPAGAASCGGAGDP